VRRSERPHGGDGWLTPAALCLYKPGNRGSAQSASRLAVFFTLCWRSRATDAAVDAWKNRAKGTIMSRRCELTGKGVQSGNLVSHSNRKTKTRFLPNLVNVTLASEALARSVRLRISAAALRSVEHRGGLDAFLVKAKTEELSQNARTLKREIEKKQAAAASA